MATISENRFQQTEEEFLRLKGRLEAGRITQEQFDAANEAANTPINPSPDKIVAAGPSRMYALAAPST